MIKFPDPPILVTGSHEWQFRLEESYRYVWRADGRERLLEVRDGFQTDLASTPRMLWWIMAPMDLGFVAPLLHDLIYRTGGKVNESEWGRSFVVEPTMGPVKLGPWDRESADRLMCRVMRQVHNMNMRWIPKYKRHMVYHALRWFGQEAFEE